jgi:hypothetical protein
MAAGITVRVYTSTNAGTESGIQTGISFLSSDSANTTTTDRQNFPITVGTRSYEKWLKLHVTTAPANNVANFKIWGDGAVQVSTTLYFTGNYATGTTPTFGTSSIANVNFNTYTSANKGTWDPGTYSVTNATTRFAVFQLAVDADSQPGNWTQETISYSYDET